MHEQVVGAQRVVRVKELSVQTFISCFLEKNQPVIVVDAMNTWRAFPTWFPDYLEERFGRERVQVYGDLFRLMRIESLHEYLGAHFGRDIGSDVPAAKSVPYVRWYCRLADDDRIPWADHIFKLLQEDWARPYFFPSSSFVLPYCGPSDSIDPACDWFPARGIFISGKGARTRLHVDPWCSDAILCQIHGAKEFVMYDPSQSPYLTRGTRVVNIESPDLEVFPEFPRSQPLFRDTLAEGEILLIPSGWFHHFTTTADSISLTWNFVHICRLEAFLSYLGAGPSDSELMQLRYAYFRAPGARSLDGIGWQNKVLSCLGIQGIHTRHTA